MSVCVKLIILCIQMSLIYYTELQYPSVAHTSGIMTNHKPYDSQMDMDFDQDCRQGCVHHEY